MKKLKVVVYDKGRSKIRNFENNFKGFHEMLKYVNHECLYINSGTDKNITKIVIQGDLDNGDTNSHFSG